MCLSKRRCVREALCRGGTDRAHRTYILMFSGKASSASVLLSTMHRENNMGTQRSRRWREEDARFRSEPPSWRSWYATRLKTSAFRVSSLYHTFKLESSVREGNRTRLGGGAWYTKTSREGEPGAVSLDSSRAFFAGLTVYGSGSQKKSQ